MLLFFQLTLILFLIVFIAILVYSMASGGPYAPIGEQKTEDMMSLLKVKPGEKAVDIGSGDGRIVIALAKKGADAHGFEINPLLAKIAKDKIKKAGLEKKAKIHTKDFWQENLSNYDIVTVYLSGHIMKLVERKLRKELKPGARVAVNYFGFSNWKPEKKKGTIYLYRK